MNTRLKEIRERHNKTTNLEVTDAYAAHKDRGELLDMLEGATKQHEADVEELHERLLTIDFERGKRIELEAQLAKVRNEYLNHIKATKSPVIVLDAIGWILEDKP